MISKYWLSLYRFLNKIAFVVSLGYTLMLVAWVFISGYFLIGDATIDNYTGAYSVLSPISSDWSTLLNKGLIVAGFFLLMNVLVLAYFKFNRMKFGKAEIKSLFSWVLLLATLTFSYSIGAFLVDLIVVSR